MANIRIKRGTRAQLESAKAASGLAAGEPYLVTDEGVMAIGTAVNAYAESASKTALDLKANLASPTFTGTVSGITKTMVGLGNVDNTSDASKPVSTAQQTALNLKANLASPTFTGTVSGITKTMVGLSAVDNTADASKPVSTAQQTALDLKADKSGKLSQFAATTSLELKGVISDETGSGALVFATSPVLVTPSIGVATGTSFNSITGLSSSSPVMDGAAAAGAATTAAKGDHVHPSDTTKANLASPTFTGTPAAPTATVGTNTTQIATTAFVVSSLTGLSPAISSSNPIYGDIRGGDIRRYIGTTDSIYVSPLACMDSTGTVQLTRLTESVVSLPAVANTIYHIFIVKLTGGTTQYRIYTTEAGVVSDTEVAFYRWIGFWRTNGSSQAVMGHMTGDWLIFGIGSENIISSSIGTTFATVSHTAIIPESRVLEIWYGVRKSTDGSYIGSSLDGTNIEAVHGFGATTSNTDNAAYSWGYAGSDVGMTVPYYSSRQFKGSTTTMSLLVHAVLVRR